VVALVLGATALGAILYYASTVDGRGPTVVGVSLTQHLSQDPRQALTTTSIEVDFSEPVEHATAEAAFAISPAVEGAFSWSASSLTFTPAARLPLRTSFEVSVASGVRDRAGNAMTRATDPFAFETVGNPTVVSSQPIDAAEAIPLDAPIVVEFSTLMDTASVEAAIRLSPSSDVSLRWSRERLTIEPSAPWQPNRRYALTVGIGARDQAGTPLAQPFRLTFTTATAGLESTALVPSDTAAGISVFTPIAVVFDQPLDPDSVQDDILTVVPDVAGSLDAIAPPGAAGLRDPVARILRFQPSGPLDPNTTYEVTLAPGLRGMDGAAMPAGLSWTFTTGAPGATLSNQVAFLSDRGGIANLWAMNPDGSNQHQLSAELSPVTSYAVAPDGRSFLTGDGAAIVWQRADGSARRNLTDPAVLEFDAAYSPDGTTITFARADPVRGSSLGLWMSDADGSDPKPIELPGDASASPLPSPSTPVPLLRTPRLSPDGTAVAFVDEAGMVGILELESQQLLTASFVALSEPIWLADGGGVIVDGLPAGSAIGPQPARPGEAVPTLDPAARTLSATQLATLRMVRLDRSATAVRATGFGSGVIRPAADPNGGFAYLRLAGGALDSGTPWVTSTLDDPGREIPGPTAAPPAWLAFAPDGRSLVIGQADPGGVWLMDVATGSAHRLSQDGWLPRWLP
jgi:WD40 repeat protein